MCVNELFLYIDTKRCAGIDLKMLFHPVFTINIPCQCLIPHHTSHKNDPVIIKTIVFNIVEISVHLLAAGAAQVVLIVVMAAH
jgi:hypothetical protein